MSEEFVTVKVKVNALKKYLVRPRGGFIMRGDSTEVRVILHSLTVLVPPDQHFILFNDINVPDGALQMTTLDWAWIV